VYTTTVAAQRAPAAVLAFALLMPTLAQARYRKGDDRSRLSRTVEAIWRLKAQRAATGRPVHYTGRVIQAEFTPIRPGERPPGPVTMREARDLAGVPPPPRGGARGTRDHKHSKNLYRQTRVVAERLIERAVADGLERSSVLPGDILAEYAHAHHGEDLPSNTTVYTVRRELNAVGKQGGPRRARSAGRARVARARGTHPEASAAQTMGAGQGSQDEAPPIAAPRVRRGGISRLEDQLKALRLEQYEQLAHPDH
jgi:hypothetical protein